MSFSDSLPVLDLITILGPLIGFFQKAVNYLGQAFSFCTKPLK
jgi:hypothetical protein